MNFGFSCLWFKHFLRTFWFSWDYSIWFLLQAKIDYIQTTFSLDLVVDELIESSSGLSVMGGSRLFDDLDINPLLFWNISSLFPSYPLLRIDAEFGCVLPSGSVTIGTGVYTIKFNAT